MVLKARQVYRDSTVEGVPVSGPWKPRKSEIRALLTGYESTLDAFTTAGGKIYTTLAQLGGDLSPAQYTSAWVIADPNVANNGVYQKIGAANTGSWIRLSDLPFSFIVADDDGAGTANAIQATTGIPVSGSALVWLTAFRSTTSTPVTVSFNGGTPLTIKTNSGENPLAGSITAGMTIAGIVSGSVFRLISDQASAAIQAACEAAAAAAAASAVVAANYASLASNNSVLDEFAGNGAQTVFTLSVAPGSIENILVIIDGVAQLKSAVASLVGTTLTLAGAPAGDGFVKNINVYMGKRIAVNSPSNGTVGGAQINTGDAAAIRTAISVYSQSQVDAFLAAAVGAAGAIDGLALSNNATDATNDIDIAIGSAASDGATPVSMPLAAGLTKRLDAAWAVGTGNGGLDTGSIANATYHVWLIQRPDTLVVDVLFSLSATAPTMPGGYTRKRRIGSIIRASAAILGFVQSGTGRERDYDLKVVSQNLASSTSAGTSAVLRTLTVPSGIKVRAKIGFDLTSNASGENLWISSPDQTDSAATATNRTATVAASAVISGSVEVLTNASSQIRTRQATGNSDQFLTMRTNGWKDFI